MGDAYEMIQQKLCSNSRKNKSRTPDRMGLRLIRNIDEALPFFAAYSDAPMLDAGCGDGFGMGYWCDKGMQRVYGVEVSQERVDVALGYELNAVKGDLETVAELSLFKAIRPFNIFCSHTLEHTRDQGHAIHNLKAIAAQIVWIIVPVEFSNKSTNAAHFSPVKNLTQIRQHFPEQDWSIIKEEYRFNLEAEGVIAFSRR